MGFEEGLSGLVSVVLGFKQVGRVWSFSDVVF